MLCKCVYTNSSNSNAVRQGFCAGGSLITKCESCLSKESLTPARGEPIPKTVEHYQANALRDQELILEQKDEISKLKQTVHKLVQRYVQGEK